MKTLWIKSQAGLVPHCEEAQEWYSKLAPLQVVHGNLTRMQTRNEKFHRKYFALLHVAFDNFTPTVDQEQFKQHYPAVEAKPEKNFKRFRNDIAILTGHYDTTIRLDGTVRLEARSISFGKMSNEEFAQLYSATVNLLLKNVYKDTLSEKELNDIVGQYLEYT